MLQGNSNNVSSNLRRSPRFLQGSHREPEHPRTPMFEARGNRVRSVHLIQQVSSENIRKRHQQDQESEKLIRSGIQSKSALKLSCGSRRTTGTEKGIRSFGCLRRSPRFSPEVNSGGSAETFVVGYSEMDGDSDRGGAEPSVNSHQNFLGSNSVRRVTRSAKHKNLCESDVKLSSGSRRTTRLDKGARNFGCVRRSPRFCAEAAISNENINFGHFVTDGVVDIGDAERGINPHQQILGNNSVKRVTRSAKERNRCGSVEIIDNKCSDSSRCPPDVLIDGGVNSDTEKAKTSLKSSKELVGKLGRRVTRASVRVTTAGDTEEISNGERNGFLDLTEILDDPGAKSGENLVKKGRDNSVKNVPHSSAACSDIIVEEGESKERDTGTERRNMSLKRKRNLVEKRHGIVEGWTKEQELALERAYIAVMPTPHFWKKVASLVPGKSAQDCFDRIHADHLTPPQPPTRSRAKKMMLSPLSISGSKLITCIDPPVKKLKYSKRQGHVTHKTLRGLLQRQFQRDRDPEADMFSVLESTLSPPAKAFELNGTVSTPVCNKETPGCLNKRCRRSSSSARKNHHSRLNRLHGATLLSPPVLKQVKNKALHEKYIDQLQRREAKRKAAFTLAAKFSQNNEAENDRHAQKIDAVKAAKNSLIFDTLDAIYQFQRAQDHVDSTFADAGDGDDDDDSVDGDEEDCQA